MNWTRDGFEVDDDKARLQQAQVGFSRVVTDEATFAYLCDVFIVESRRGRGLGRWLLGAVGRGSRP